MGLVLWRIALILGGLFVLAATQQANQPGTFLGFYPFDSAARVGFNLGHAAFVGLGLWFLYAGVTGRRIRRRRVVPVTDDAAPR